MEINKCLIFVVIIVLPIVCGQSGQEVVLNRVTDPNVPSLCADPLIHGADRMHTNFIQGDIYRVYRGDYFWELSGLPATPAQVNGPYSLKEYAPGMPTFTEKSSIFTIIGGTRNGYTYRYEGERYWVFKRSYLSGIMNPEDEDQPKEGMKWGGFPPGGFESAYNDGNMGEKVYPMTVAFQANQVFYFNTYKKEFRRIGPHLGSFLGMFNESFPGDITAAFAFPSTDLKVRYFVYLFRKDIYCYRPISNHRNCEKWRKNVELFGCLNTTSTTVIQNIKTVESPHEEEVQTEEPPFDNGKEQITEEYDYYEYEIQNSSNKQEAVEAVVLNRADPLTNYSCFQNLFYSLFTIFSILKFYLN